MSNFLTRSLMSKTVLFFLVVALAPTIFVGYIGFSNARDALNQAALNQVEVARDAARSAVIEYVNETVTDLKFLSDTLSVQATLEILYFYEQGSGENKNIAIDIGSDEYNRIVAEIDQTFQRWLKLYEKENAFHDLLMIVGDKTGHVAYTLKRGPDLGIKLSSDAWKETDLAELWRIISKNKKPAIVDFSNYKPSKSVSAFAGVPVFGSDKNEFLGILAVRIGPDAIDKMVSDLAEIGATGDAFIVGPDDLLRTDSRFAQGSILTKKVDTKAAEEALAGKTGIGSITGMRGIPVLNAWAPVNVGTIENLKTNFTWGIIAKIDASEAFAPAGALARKAMLIALIAAVLVALAAYLLARTITRPITAIADQASEVSNGDLTVTIPAQDREDEVGVLAKAFHQMLDHVRTQTRRTLEGVNVLASSAAEISSTVSQLSASASKTSSAITETTTTVEEVRQAARTAGEKAKSVAVSSQEAVRTSEEGKKATEDTIHRMNLIKEQMESIGETVVRLSEHSQAIEEIIAAVQDLADQSNLLAVNASIEAARAGDQGKGFAVVAHEIKSLADQSKDATEQVRTILEDTRKWVGAVVMATEQGVKAVDAGVAQSEAAGESIQTLAQNVFESSQAAGVIDASAQQQFTGVDQVSSAMVSIEQAMQQNLAGTSQLEDSARRLAELGEELKRLVSTYKI